jgi:hypothetical protein
MRWMSKRRAIALQQLAHAPVGRIAGLAARAGGQYVRNGLSQLHAGSR